MSLLAVLETSSASRDARTQYRLSEVMHMQLGQLEAMIREMLETLEMISFRRPRKSLTDPRDEEILTFGASGRFWAYTILEMSDKKVCQVLAETKDRCQS